MDRYMLFPSGMGQHPNGPYALYTDAQATIAALQAERDEYKTMYACLTGETYDNPIADLKAQLTQRTAELEAAQREARLQKEVEAALLSKVAEYEVELNGDPQNFYGRGRTVGLRTLVLALPKAEGHWTVSCALAVTVVTGGIVRDISEVVAAILKHRQGMEG